MTEETRTRNKYAPPDGKPAYRVGITDEKGLDVLRLFDPGFESASDALKYAKANVTEPDTTVFVVRIVDHKTTESVPARLRWK